MEVRSDVVVCPFYVREQSYSIVDFGVNYFKAQSTFLVPRPKLTEFYWYSIFEGIENNVWISSGLLFIIVIAAIMFCRLLYWMTFTPSGVVNGTPQDIFFELLSILLTGNAITTFGIPGYTFILTIWSIFALFIGIFYASDLVTYLALTHYEKSINSPQDFFASDLNWTLTYRFDLSTNINEEFIKPLEEKLYIANDQINNQTNLLKNISNGKLGVFSILRDNVPIPVSLPVKHIPPEIVYSLHVMREHFYTGNVAPVYRKNSPYKSKMEENLMFIVDFGIFEHIKKTEMRKQFPTLWNSLSDKTKQEQTAKPLTIDQIYGAILIFIIGHGLSSIILVIELIIPRTLKYMQKPIHSAPVVVRGPRITIAKKATKQKIRSSFPLLENV